MKQEYSHSQLPCPDHKKWPRGLGFLINYTSMCDNERTETVKFCLEKVKEKLATLNLNWYPKNIMIDEAGAIRNGIEEIYGLGARF